MSQNTTENEVLVKLVYAAESGDLSLLQTLLTGHHDLALHGDYSFVGLESRTLLHIACIAGKRESVVELLRAGADPNAVDGNGTEALVFASERPRGGASSDARYRLMSALFLTRLGRA